MHRFYLSPEQCQPAALALTGDEAHHALRVLRLQPGDTVTVLNGAGQELSCRVSDLDRRTARLEVLERKTTPPLPCQITLLQSVPKGKIIESIIQKATELGVHRIVPLLAERVTTRLDDAAAAAKAAQWQHVAIEAIKQCGAAWLPRVDVPLTPEKFLAKREAFDLELIGSLQPDARHPSEFLREFQSKHARPPKSVAIWIGPEGDFSLEELRAIQAGGALPVTLGRLVLRVETAAIYCLSFLNYELQFNAPATAP